MESMYKVVRGLPNFYRSEIHLVESWLNEMYEQGWELVGIESSVSDGYSSGETNYIFKRIIQKDKFNEKI